MEKLKMSDEVLEYCVLMGRSFMLTKKVQSIALPTGYLNPEQGITLESILYFGGVKYEFGRPRLHKKNSGFFCFRASLQGSVVYYFCVRFTKGLNQPTAPTVFIFLDSDLAGRCIYDALPVDSPTLELMAHPKTAVH
jgi:hypothetical protein